ncbi:hypothetical protein BHE74_00035538 [Ensete ventricosum]|nr:hypothetical protein BHE74_00035538 [Ensete ventricosum]RZS11742.1 hypothetical protein BHM03_00043105 [Ensete ventricosum]
MGIHTSLILQKNVTVIKFRKVMREVEFRSIFCAPSRKFEILAIPKRKLTRKVEFRSDFRAPSRKFKILPFLKFIREIQNGLMPMRSRMSTVS